MCYLLINEICTYHMLTCYLLIDEICMYHILTCYLLINEIWYTLYISIINYFYLKCKRLTVMLLN